MFSKIILDKCISIRRTREKPDLIFINPVGASIKTNTGEAYTAAADPTE